MVVKQFLISTLREMQMLPRQVLNAKETFCTFVEIYARVLDEGPYEGFRQTCCLVDFDQ